MNKTTARVCAAAALALILASCAGGPGALFSTRRVGPFVISAYGKTIPAHDDTDTELDISFALADTAKEGLRPVFRSAVYGGLSAEDYSAKVSGELETAFRRTMNDSDWGAGHGWTYDEEQRVSLKEPFAVLTQSVYTFMGGAHGNQKTTHYVFDVDAARLLALGAVVDAARLRPLVDRELRRYSQKVSKEPLPADKPLSSGIFFTDAAVPGDYFPAPDGLHLYWNQYDIAPYVYGAIEITIPWKDLTLKADGRRLAEAYHSGK